MVKVGSHEDVVRSTSMLAMIPHKGGLQKAKEQHSMLIANLNRQGYREVKVR
jgi:hypothetical protein